MSLMDQLTGLATLTYHNFRCPVCSQNLAELGPATEQEAHVRRCLDGSMGQSPPTAKYVVYQLTGESALIGIECKIAWSIVDPYSFSLISGVICLEEFVEGCKVALLGCLCSFHDGKCQIQFVFFRYSNVCVQHACPPGFNAENPAQFTHGIRD